MKNFKYKARDQQGKIVKGALAIESKELAVADLREQGLYVAQITEVPQSTLSQITLFQKKSPLKIKLLALLCRQFAILLQAGVSLVEVLQILEVQTVEKRLNTALQSIRLDVASGTSFTDAVTKHRNLFSHEFIHLIEAGEVAGELPAAFNQMAVYYEREDELRKRVSEALMYPSIIAVVAVIVVFALVFVVLPMLIDNFSAFGVQVPPITQMVLNGRDWAVANWYIIIGIVFVIGTLLRWYLKTKPGRFQKDFIALNLPVVGELNKMVIFSRFCRVLGLLLKSGISMIRSLEIVERLVENVVIKNSLKQSRLAVEKGQGLTEPLKNNKAFPTMLVQMIAVGEETGSLELTLGHLSNYYDKEVDFSVSAFTKLLEPIMMFCLAIVVMFILISVYLPMMQMMTQL